ncbi:uncharacterized protein LOC131215169 [Anopheles bellator]|uniref:uncharacterized protein LOC131215169 n=1 Tax=Anopheles bellator TaxID=139047 RepID=UPI00264750EC|nr:uncharacterized protein LOC131215169 [Anopheles bellator]
MSKLLALHRPTTISKLAPLVPESSVSRPSGNVPQWHDLLPSQKLPDFRNATGNAMQLSRGFLGQPIWQFPADHGFDLTDPLNRIVHRNYHPLHDEHLQKFWKGAYEKVNLKFHGLIGDADKVLCTLREFNQFRAFLFEQFKVKLKKRIELEQQDREDGVHCSNMTNHVSRFGDYDKKLKATCKRAERMFDQKNHEWKESITEYRKKIDKFTQEQHKKQSQRLKAAEENDFILRFYQQQLQALRRTKMLKLKRRLKDRDALVQQRLSCNETRKAAITSQLERDEKKQIMDKFLKQMTENVQRRKEWAREQHTKLESDLVHRKTINLAKKYERRSRQTLVKAILRECKKSFHAKDPSALEDPALRRGSIEQTIKAALAIHTAISPTTSSIMIIDTASEFISDLRIKPSEPLPLDRLTVQYVVDRLAEIMEQILHRKVAQACDLIEKVATKKSDRLHSGDQTLRSSLCSYQSDRTETRNGPLRSKVSLGPVSTVEEFETECVQMRQCKNRAPTPVTSVTSLVECAMGEPEMERANISRLVIPFETQQELERCIHGETYPLIHIMYSQRRYLEGNCLKYRLIVEPYVEQRVLAAINLEHLTITAHKSTRVSKDKLLHRTAVGLLKFPENDVDYAKAILDGINYLSTVATRKVEEILNEP